MMKKDRYGRTGLFYIFSGRGGENKRRRKIFPKNFKKALYKSKRVW